MTEEQKKKIEEDLKNEKESALSHGYKYTYCGICGKKLSIKKAYGTTARVVENDDGNLGYVIQLVCKKCFKETEKMGIETINEAKE